MPLFGRSARDHPHDTRYQGPYAGGGPSARLPPSGRGKARAKAGFEPVDAEMLTLNGPSGQEARATAFADDFYLSVHLDSPPTPAIA